MPQKWFKAASDIHGNGAFALDRIPKGDSVGNLTNGLRGGGLLGEIRTDLGKLINHKTDANSIMKRVPSTTDTYFLQASTDIEPGVELTMDYNKGPWFVAKPHQVDPLNYKSWG